MEYKAAEKYVIDWCEVKFNPGHEQQRCSSGMFNHSHCYWIFAIHFNLTILAKGKESIEIGHDMISNY